MNAIVEHPSTIKNFQPIEYILIDIASQWGLDKETFEDRLAWAKAHMGQFHQMAKDRGHWKEHPLFIKSVMGLDRVLQGQPVGMMVGMDAICSGMQVLSAVTGCLKGGHSTGLVDPEVRADAYTKCTRIMQRSLPSLPDGERKAIKDAVKP